MNDPLGYRILAVEPLELSPAELREAALLYQALEHERTPEDPPTPVEAIERRLRADVPDQWRAFFGARDAEGALIGYGVVSRSLNEPENAHLRWTELAVSREAPPEGRRAGADAQARGRGRRSGRRRGLHGADHRPRSVRFRVRETGRRRARAST